MTDRADPHLLVVGIDAGCLPVLRPLFDRGEVPTLRRLIEEGASGPLESQIPPWTGSAWPSIYTGKNPGKHGVFDFLAFDGYEWDVVNATRVRERSIWELLSDRGVSSVVVNVPVTHPARPFDGALIPGLTAPENPTCHPEGLLDDVEEHCGEYRVYPQSGPEPDRSIEAYERTIECRGSAFRYLLRRFEPGFGFLQFQVTDSVFHERPGDARAIRAVYRAVDRELEAILSAFDPANVLLVSDHGIKRVEGHEFRANSFLRDRGYLRSVRGGEGMPTWSAAWENALLDGEDAGESGSEPGSLERAMAVAARFGVTTQRVAAALDAIGLKDAVGKRVPNDLQRAASEVVDFPDSRAYVRSKSELGVRINLEGREPSGAVPADEYEAVRDDLIEALSAVETPDGDPVFESVAPRERHFEGPEIDRGPDVVTVPANFDNALVADVADEVFADPWEPWNHARTGVVAATGDDVDESASLDGAHVFDVAPTICSLFGVPIDADMDGDPLQFAARAGDVIDEREYEPYEADPIAPTDDETVESRLSDLGYL